MLKVKKLSKSYGPLVVLSDVSFALERGQRAALVGHNGTGKSTLLRILMGLEEADSGTVELDRKISVGYLPQDTSVAGKESIESYLLRVTGIDVIDREMESLADQLSDPASKRRYEDLHARYERMDGYSFMHRMEVMLSGFGLDGVRPNRPLSMLSSGQKTKVALMGILLQEADLLLLDEPTNNLDLPALIWLEDFLGSSSAACIVVSHDRRFLDRIADRVMELDWSTHSLTVRGGTYTDYLRMTEKLRERQKEQYRQQQEEIGRLTDQARQLKQRAIQGARWTGSDNDKFLRGFKRDRAGKSGKGAKAIEKRIEQMEKIEKPIERRPLNIPLRAGEEYANLDIRLTEVVAGYPDGFRVGPLSLTVRYGERVAILGLNGAGKSTLLQTVIGGLKPLAGQVDVGPGVHVGDMTQEHDSLPRESTPLEYLKDKVGLSDEQGYVLLDRFGIETDAARSPIAALSPGARARLLLGTFSALAVNVLVLDEPTNHLDMEAMEALEDALQTYSGSVILVSHDRYFLEKISLDWIYLLEGGRLAQLEDFEDYLRRVEERVQKLLRLL